VKLTRDSTTLAIERALRSSSELAYGAERTEEIAEQIRHLAEMLHELAQSRLDLTGIPPDTTGIKDRTARS
jgi:hypothetical protein